MSISGIAPGLPIIGGFQWRDRIEPIPSTLAAATTTAAWTSNDVNLTRFRVARAFTATKLAICLGATAAGSVALGISTSTDFSTYTKVADTGIQSPTLNSENQFSITPYLFVPDVDYWFALGVTDGTITILRLGMVAFLGTADKSNLKKASAWSSGLPASLSGLTGSSAAPWFALIA